MIMFAMSFDDPGSSVPNCSYSFPDALRLEVPRKDDYYVRDVAVQVGEYLSTYPALVTLSQVAQPAYICPKLRSIAHRLSAICDEFEKEFVLQSEEQQEDPPSVFDCLLNWLF